MEINFLAILGSAAVPLLVGFFWYSKLLFADAWMKVAKMKPEDLASFNPVKVFSLCFLFSIFISLVLQFLVIHQSGALGMIGGDPTSAKESFTAFMSDYGTAFRTFKHGALHGSMTGILFVLPMLGINALFEKFSWKYVLIHGGYWTVCLGIMGGILCQWA
jgi:hypothetical protein